MAATNKQCFNKNCLCATCQRICSRCSVVNEQCEAGTEMCTCYKKISYKEYIQENQHSKITEEEYNELLSNVAVNKN